MKQTKPKRRQSFRGPGNKLYHLRDMIEYAVAGGNDRSLQRYLRLFGEALHESGTDDGSIMLQDHWAWWLELRHDYARAAKHRRREIQIVRRLFEMGGPIGPINKKFLKSIERSLARDEELSAAASRSSAAKRPTLAARQKLGSRVPQTETRADQEADRVKQRRTR
jgi:hypothetical protein